jgi:hypothetical protein
VTAKSRVRRLWLLVGLLVARRAAADGAFPDSMALFAPADRPHTLLLATNFGLVTSDDDGTSWQLVCEQAIAPLVTGYQESAPPDDTLYAMTPSGLFFSADRGCSWQASGGHVAGAPIADIFPDPDDPTQLYSIAHLDDGSAAGVQAVLRSSDGGKSFVDAPLYTAPAGVSLTGVESARAAPRPLYLTMFAYPPLTPIVARAAHGVVAASAFEIFDESAYFASAAYLAAVDPVDPEVLYLRLRGNTGDALAISRDHGATIATVVPLGGRMTSFLRRQSGTLLVGSDNRASLRSSDGGKTFAPWAGAPHVRTLAERGDRLYVVGDDARDGFAIAFSDDEGGHWQPLLHFRDITGPLACGDLPATCAGPWAALKALFDQPAAGADAGATVPVDAGSVAPPSSPGSASGCGCSIGAAGDRFAAGDASTAGDRSAAARAAGLAALLSLILAGARAPRPRTSGPASLTPIRRRRRCSMRQLRSTAPWMVAAASAALCLLLLVAGCAAAGGRTDPGGDGGAGHNGDGGGGGVGGNGDGGPIIPGRLTISPIDQVVAVTGAGPTPTLQFIAALDHQTVPANWTIDRGELGNIDGSGLFTPGNVGGKGHIIATYGADNASTSITVQLSLTQLGDPNHDSPPPIGPGGYQGVGGDGPGGTPSDTQRGTLEGTPTPDGNVEITYPYDGTVWPRGLLPPLIQWNAGSHHFDSAYISFHEEHYDYKGFFTANKPSGFVNLPIPALPWKQLTYSNRGEDVNVKIVFAEGTHAYGPYTLKWRIAPATLKGTIYYNSYGTYLVKNSGTDGLDYSGKQYGAATLAIKPGADAPVKVAGVDSISAVGDGRGCRVCHTVAANGKALVTQGSNIDATDYNATYYVDLLNDTTNGAGTKLATDRLVYPALYPDASMLFASSGGYVGFGYDNVAQSGLYKLPAGTLLTTTKGLPSGFQATLPVFSPDGKHLAFNFWSGSFAGGPSGDQRSLALLDFDAGNTTFSNARIAYTPAGIQPVTFSSFLPDSSGVVFQVETDNPSETWGGTWLKDKAEIWWHNLKSGENYKLSNLNGVNLPSSALHPPGQDAQVNYEPTINPIASGGYAWVVFTSRRLYGNVATLDPWLSDPKEYDATTGVTDKKLWVAAIDLHADEIGTVMDPSHPAFYLPAQEIHAGNSRGFWTPDPCHQNGASCETGDECCGGYCQNKGGMLVCSPDKPPCAAEFEKCDITADCCGAADGIECVNHICTQSVPIS